MAALLGSSKTLTTDNTRLKKKMTEVLPHLKVTDTLVSVFTEVESSVRTKKEKDEASKLVRNNLADMFGLKFNEKALQDILGTLGKEAIQLEIVKVKEEDLETMLECLGTDITSKLKYAIADMSLLGVRITYNEISMVGLLLVEIDDTTIWLPVNLAEEEEGTISTDDCMKINRFVQNSLGEKYPHNYAATVTGPRGGTLSIGRVFTVTKKDADLKVRKEMAGKCSIEY